MLYDKCNVGGREGRWQVQLVSQVNTEITMWQTDHSDQVSLANDN